MRDEKKAPQKPQLINNFQRLFFTGMMLARKEKCYGERNSFIYTDC